MGLVDRDHLFVDAVQRDISQYHAPLETLKPAVWQGTFHHARHCVGKPVFGVGFTFLLT